jgi:NADH-quinone oxidoreductase subunit J
MDPQALHEALFWIIALLTGICAISVVVTQNIVRSATWLLFTLAGTAGIFFLLGADFVGATQLLIYVGGTLVLVVFGVMLTAQGPFVNLRAGAVEWAFTTVVGLSLLAVLAVSLLVWKPRYEGASPLMAEGSKDTESKADEVRAGTPVQSVNSAVLGQAFLGLREATPDAPLTGTPPPRPSRPGEKPEVPRRTKMSYLLPFEIVSVHLLVVLIGAAYLARAKRRRGAALP